MKKTYPIMLLAVLLSGCSGLVRVRELILPSTPSIVPDTATPQPTVTLFPTKDLFATLTSTPVTFAPTKTPFIPDQPPTETPSPIPTFKLPSTLAGDTFFTPQNKGFVTVLVSGGALYWNTGPCSPRSLTVTAFVEDIVHTDSVLLAMRPREKSDTMLLGDWSYVEMIPGDNGSYTYEVGPGNIRKYYWFKDAWIEYQFVSYDRNKVELARTQVYNKTLSLIMCHPISP